MPDGRTSLIRAAHNGHTEVAELLIRADTVINANDDKGNTALDYAKEKGHDDMVQLLIEAGAVK